MNDETERDPRLAAIPDIHGHAKGEHKPYAEERPIPLSARMLFLWFFHACRRGWPRFLMVSDHMNYLTFEDPAAVNLVRRALKLAQAGDLYGAAETASVDVGHAAVVSEGLRRGMRYSIGAEVDNDPRSRPDAQNIVDAMKPDGMIRSVHFLSITHPVHGENWNWPFDNPEFKELFDVVGTEQTWKLYMAALLDAIERLPGHIVGHFYVPAVFGHWPDDATLERYEDQLVAACEARGMAIEFNTRLLYRDVAPEEKEKYLAAHERLLKKAKAKNIGIAVGSDAHSPRDQGGAFETVLRVLDACDINEIVFPIAGRLARVALRVERKPEPEPAAAPVAVDTSAEDKKPLVRKARTSEAPTRPKQTSPQRDDPADPAAPEEPGAADAAPARPSKAKKRPPAAVDADAPAAEAAAQPAHPPEPTASVPPAPAPVSKHTGLAAAAGAAPKPARIPKAAAVPKPAVGAKAAVKIPSPGSRSAAAAPSRAAGKSAPARAASVKAPAKAAAKARAAKPPASAKAPTARNASQTKSSRKVAPPKKTSAARPTAKKTAATTARKPAPPKKAAPKKPAPKKTPPKRASAKPVPAKKASGKKTPVKKSGSKRR